MTSRRWVKFYCEQWLSGTIRDEPPEIRAVFVDLLALAGGGQYGDVGEIKLANGIGYTDQQISEILRIRLALWRRAKSQLITSNRIETTSKGAITIVNWSKYQSDYQRQKPYRQKQAGDALSPEPPPYPLPIKNQNENEKENENKKESYTEKLQPEVTTKGYTTHEPSTSEERNPTTRVTGLEDGYDILTTPHTRDTTPTSSSGRELNPTLAGKSSKDRLLSYLQSNGVCTLDQLSAALGIRYGSVQVHLNALKRDGLVSNRERGRWRALDV